MDKAREWLENNERAEGAGVIRSLLTELENSSSDDVVLALLKKRDKQLGQAEAERDALQRVLEERGVTLLTNYAIDDEFRDTLHRYIDEQEDGEWITLIRFRPPVRERIEDGS